MTAVIGLDLSLTNSGIARVRTSTAGLPVIDHFRTGTPTAGQDLRARSRRLRTLAWAVADACAGADLVLLEAPSSYGGQSTGSQHDRSGLWWLVVARLEANGIPTVEVAPAHLKMYATGRGGGKGAGKDEVLAATVRRYRDQCPELSTNDEADAVQLAALGWHHWTGAPVVDLPATHTRAVDLVVWPEYANPTTGGTA